MLNINTKYDNISTTKTFWSWASRSPIINQSLIYLIILNIITKLQLLVPRFNADDYNIYTSHSVSTEIIANIRDGRILIALLVWMCDWFGVTLYSVSIFNSVVHWIGVPWAVSLLADKMRLDRPRDWWLFSVMVALNPFLLENVLFNGYSGATSLGFCLSLIAISLIEENTTTKRAIISIVFCVSTLALYQPHIIVFCVGAALVIFRMNYNEYSFNVIKQYTLLVIKILIISVFLYLILYYTSRSIITYYKLDIVQWRHVALPSLYTILKREKEAFLLMYLAPTAGYPPLMRCIIGFTFLASIGVAMRRKLRPTSYLKATLIVSCILLFSPGVILFTSDWWLPQRVVSQNGLVMGGVIALQMSMSISENLVERCLFGALTAVLTVGLAFQSAQIVLEHHVIMGQDFRMATELVGRLERLVVENMPARIAVVKAGPRWGYPLGNRATYGGMNTSAFEAPWAQVRILEVVSGYRFAEPSQDEIAEAQRKCSSVVPYPGPNSVSIVGQLGIICL